MDTYIGWATFFQAFAIVLLSSLSLGYLLLFLSVLNMPLDLDGLASPDYGHNLLSSNMRLITEMQSHLRKIQELAVSIADPKGYSAVPTSDFSSTGTRSVHHGPFSITFSSTVTDRSTSYTSEVSITENKIGWHERTEILDDIPGSRLQLSAIRRRLKLNAAQLDQPPSQVSDLPFPISLSDQKRTPISQMSTNKPIIEDMDDYMDKYLNDIDWLSRCLLVSTGEVARARRPQNVIRAPAIPLNAVDRTKYMSNVLYPALSVHNVPNKHPEPRGIAVNSKPDVRRNKLGSYN